MEKGGIKDRETYKGRALDKLVGEEVQRIMERGIPKQSKDRSSLEPLRVRRLSPLNSRTHGYALAGSGPLSVPKAGC